MRYGIFYFFFILFILFAGTSANQGGKTIRYELINEFEVIGVSARDIWAVYSSRNLPKLIVKLLPSMFERIDIVEGDGGLGTVIRLVYPPGSVPLTYKEKFVTINNRNRLKEVLQIQGGYLNMGVIFYMDSFQILSKGHNACIIRSISKYQVKDEFQAKVSPIINVDSLLTMARAISKYVLDQKKAASANTTVSHEGRQP